MLPLYEHRAKMVLGHLGSTGGQGYGGGIAGYTLSPKAKENMSKAALIRTHDQSKRQLETWNDPEIAEARRCGLSSNRRKPL
jgi:hypothetical protein